MPAPWNQQSARGHELIPPLPLLLSRCPGRQPGELPRAALSGPAELHRRCSSVLVSSCQSTFDAAASSTLQEAGEAGRFGEWPDVVMP